MRRLAGYALLLLALAASLPAIGFLLLSVAIGLDVRITEPTPLLIGGIVSTVVMFWGARVLLSRSKDALQRAGTSTIAR